MRFLANRETNSIVFHEELDVATTLDEIVRLAHDQYGKL